jgi:hypothetical protein
VLCTVSEVDDDDGTYNGDGIIIVCSGAQVLALRKVKHDSLHHHTRRNIVDTA